MKSLFSFTILTLSLISLQAQKLVWTSENGGIHENGAIISYDLSSETIQTEASLEGNFMQSFSLFLEPNFTSDRFALTGGMIKASDGHFYGINEYGNSNLAGAHGILYRFNTTDSIFELLHSFTGPGPNRINYNLGNYASFNHGFEVPALGIIEGSPGVIYGLAMAGGSSNEGGVWKYDIAQETYAKVDEFDTIGGGVGRDPNSPLIIGPNGDLFGVIQKSGPWGAANTDGHLYKVDLANQDLVYVSSLSAAGWAIADPVCQITYNSSLNKIFGTKEQFSGGNWGGGVYSYDFNNNQVTNETFIPISAINTLGTDGNGMTPIANDGNHYFVCRNGGAHGMGTLVRYVPGANTMTKVHDFHTNPNGTGMIISGSKIYGSYDELSPGEPMVWAYDVSSGIASDIAIGTSDSTLGYLLSKNFVVENNNLIGRTLWGGPGDAGTVFNLHTTSGQTEVLLAAGSPEGRSIKGELLQTNDSSVIGFSPKGGKLFGNDYSDHGQTVALNLVNQNFSVDSLYSKTYETSRAHHVSYLAAVQSENGSVIFPYRNNAGVFPSYFTFKVYPGNGDPAYDLYNFEPDDALESGMVEIEDNVMLTAYHDSLHVFNLENGNHDVHPITFSNDSFGFATNHLCVTDNGIIYGLTIARNFESSLSKTVIYRVDTVSWMSHVIHVFEEEIKEHNAGLTWSGTKLYGNTFNGGDNDHGYLYSYDISTGSFAIEHHFDYATDGGGFTGKWTEFEGILYATSYTGGQHGYGTLASYSTLTDQFNTLAHLTLSNGRPYMATPLLWDDTFLNVNELSNGQKAIQLYPNPVVDQMNIMAHGIKNIEVYNLTGQLLISTTKNNINTQNWNSGIYIVRVQTTQQERSFKVIK